MNILLLSWRGPGHPHGGGAEVSTHEHAKGWVKSGHNVTLFTSYYSSSKKNEIIDGVNIIRRGGQFFRVHWEAFKWYVFEDHPRYDIVIDQFHGIPFFTPLYVKAKKLAFIHEVTKEVWRLNPWPKPLNLLPAILGTIFEPLVFKLFYKKIPFMTVSQSSKNDLIFWGIPKENITVVHNGLNLPKVKNYSPKEDKKTVIFLGVLSRDKGIEDALKIFSKLEQTNSDWQFWVVGKGVPAYLKSLKSRSKQLGIDRKIKFWGFVSERLKFELLKRAHLLINPSIREGWGLVVIEAASRGTPTVAFNVPGLRDSIIDGKTGILCSENTIENLANNILGLLKDEGKYNIISRNAISWSKNFSWEKASQESLKLIETTVFGK